jgi:esterase/lipase superfamily enzyme
VGELEGPSIVRLEFRENPEKYVILLSSTPEQPESFSKRVSDRVAQSSAHEALVFIHGFNVTFEDAA